MSYLQRKMFANGGGAEANPYYYVSADRKLVPLDSNQLYDVLSTAGIGELTALIQNPDVEYSPATQELFRRVVGERRGRRSSTTPNNLEFGKVLPDYLDFYSGLENIGGIAKDTILEGVERGVGLFSGFMADQGDPQDLFVSERFPFNRQGQPLVDPFQGRPDPTNAPEIIGRAAEGLKAKAKTVPPLFDRSGSLRRGFSNPELAAILNRAQSGEIQDFEEEIEELVKPDVVDTAVVEEVTDQDPRELPTGTVEIRNISPEEYKDSNIRRLKYEMEMVGRDEFGNPLPESRLLQDPEIQDILDEIKPIELKVDVDKTEADSLLDVEEKFDGLPDSEVKDLIDPIKPILSIPEAAAEEQEEQDEGQPPPPRDVITRKLEQPGFFGSDRFLDFIRNVGGELTRTGQFGTGLSLGASKAAEERAARELMAEQEERDFASKLRLARAEAALEAAGEGAYDKDKIKTYVEFEETLTGAMKNFDEDERIVSDLNKILNEDINDPNAFGARGFITKITEDLRAAAGMGAKEWSELSPAKRIQTILDVTAQRSVRNILGESGKTISNLDRELVANIFGSVNIFTSPAELKKKLEDSRAQVIEGMRGQQNTITSNATALQEAGYPSRVLQNNIPLLQRILKFNFDDIENYTLGSNATGYIETTL
jgi:hypothetical protein